MCNIFTQKLLRKWAILVCLMLRNRNISVISRISDIRGRALVSFAKTRPDITSLNNRRCSLNNAIYMQLHAYMQCNQLQLQITRDQLDNIKLYDKKIESKLTVSKLYLHLNSRARYWCDILSNYSNCVQKITDCVRRPV